jgi:hypothetical protein
MASANDAIPNLEFGNRFAAASADAAFSAVEGGICRCAGGERRFASRDRAIARRTHAGGNSLARRITGTSGLSAPPETV